jgi:hypothetical protein
MEARYGKRRRTGREQELPAGTHVFALYHEHPAIDVPRSAGNCGKALRYIQRNGTYEGMLRHDIPEKAFVVAVNLRSDRIAVTPQNISSTNRWSPCWSMRALRSCLVPSGCGVPGKRRSRLILTLHQRGCSHISEAIAPHPACNTMERAVSDSLTSDDAYERLMEDAVIVPSSKVCPGAVSQPEHGACAARLMMTKTLLPTVAGYVWEICRRATSTFPPSGFHRHSRRLVGRCRDLRLLKHPYEGRIAEGSGIIGIPNDERS